MSSTIPTVIRKGSRWEGFVWHSHQRPKDFGDDFYRSPEWKAIRNAEIRSNMRHYNRKSPTCERCGAWWTWRFVWKKLWKFPIHYPAIVERKFHGDHIFPRSLFPERELDPDNVQTLCACCNVAKSNRTSINWKRYRRWPLRFGYPVVWALRWHQRAFLGWSV